jgi:hypothetical protein
MATKKDIAAKAFASNPFYGAMVGFEDEHGIDPHATADMEADGFTMTVGVLPDGVAVLLDYSSGVNVPEAKAKEAPAAKETDAEKPESAPKATSKAKTS